MKVPFKIKNNMKNHTLVKLSMILLILALIFGCEKANDSKHNPPADHTISKDGFYKSNCSRFSIGSSLALEFLSSSHPILSPEMADSLPRIAVRVDSAPDLVSLI